MASKGELTREQRIKREITRLRRSYKDMDKDRKPAAESLSARIAFMLITLEDLETDINQNGTTEEYQNGKDTMPMTRQRAAVQAYNSTVKSYTTACKQLAELIPESKGTNNINPGASKPDPFQQIMKRERNVKRVK